MFCTKCGTKNQDDAQFCYKCGNSLLAIENAEIQKYNPPVSLDTRSSESDVITTEKLHYHSEAAPYPLRRHLKKTVMFFVFIFLAVWITMFFGRSVVDSILQRINSSREVHLDASKIDTGVERQVKQAVFLVYQQQDGQVVRILADEEVVSEFARKSINMLESERVKLRSTVRNTVHDAVDTAFTKMREQVTPYADWYFAWSTSYKILAEAVKSAVDHAMKPEAMSLKEAVEIDVERYLQKHFEEIVLRPEISDPEIKEGFGSAIKRTNDEFHLVMSQLDQQFQKFAAEQSNLLEMVDTKVTKADLDWNSQFNKVTTAKYERGSGDVLVGAGLAAGGAMLGKSIVPALGKVTASKFLSGAALKGLTTKLAAPFVVEATAAGTVAGPVGSVLGAAAGLGLDYLVNKGVALSHRDDFISDTNDAINATQIEWENEMTQSIEKSVDIWFEDTINLFAKYSKT